MNARAYAKINLGLHIVGKRQDGFHNIETIFHRINLFDQINIENSEDISISCTDPSIPIDGGNLCWKAVESLRNGLGIKRGARIEIKKNIPAGAGLGGGSSDAAAVLSMLPSLWDVRIERTAMEKCALQLGSDVPFFLQRSTVYAEGRGEIMQAIDLAIPYWIVVVYPDLHLSTPWAYNRLAEKRKGVFPDRRRMLEKILPDPLRAILTTENDFEEIVFEKHIKIKEIKVLMEDRGAKLSLMSGSGSSMFGLFDEEDPALKTVEYFKKEHFVHLTEPYFSLRHQ